MADHVIEKVRFGSAAPEGKTPAESSAEVDRIRAAYATWEGTLDRGNRGFRVSLRERNAALGALLRRCFPKDLAACRVLDIGCGRGDLLAWFHEQGTPAGNLIGVDILAHRIAAAREAHSAFTFLEGTAEQFGFADGSFDLVAVFTVFSSILADGFAHELARTIRRVLKPDGAVIWYDMRYRNPRNPNVRPFTRRRIQELFPDFGIELRQITLLPPVYRRLGRMTEQVYPLLASVPVFRSHYLGLLCPSRQH